MISITPQTKKKRRVPLMPLIDVIFILVMFFLLSSTFGVWQALDVRLAKSGTSAGSQTGDALEQLAPAPVLITVRPAGAAGGVAVQVNGVRIAPEGLLDELNRMASLGAEAALLLPSAQVDFQTVVDILDTSRASDLKAVTLTVK